MKITILKSITVLLTSFIAFSTTAQASFEFDRSDSAARDSLFEAMDRSRQDHTQLRNKATKATWEQMEAWEQRSNAVITIEGTAGLESGRSRLEVQGADFEFQGAIPKFEAEANEQDIEKELREVSSL